MGDQSSKSKDNAPLKTVTPALNPAAACFRPRLNAAVAEFKPGNADPSKSPTPNDAENAYLQHAREMLEDQVSKRRTLAAEFEQDTKRLSNGQTGHLLKQREVALNNFLEIGLRLEFEIERAIELDADSMDWDMLVPFEEIRTEFSLRANEFLQLYQEQGDSPGGQGGEDGRGAEPSPVDSVLIEDHESQQAEPGTEMQQPLASFAPLPLYATPSAHNCGCMIVTEEDSWSCCIDKGEQ